MRNAGSFGLHVPYIRFQSPCASVEPRLRLRPHPPCTTAAAIYTAASLSLFLDPIARKRHANLSWDQVSNILLIRTMETDMSNIVENAERLAKEMSDSLKDFPERHIEALSAASEQTKEAIDQLAKAPVDRLQNTGSNLASTKKSWLRRHLQ